MHFVAFYRDVSHVINYDMAKSIEGKIFFNAFSSIYEVVCVV